MALNFDQLKGLIGRLSRTREHEVNCNEFLERMAELAEHDVGGIPVPDALEAIEYHLELCPECREEYEALLAVLKRIE